MAYSGGRRAMQIAPRCTALSPARVSADTPRRVSVAQSLPYLSGPVCTQTRSAVRLVPTLLGGARDGRPRTRFPNFPADDLILCADMIDLHELRAGQQAIPAGVLATVQRLFFDLKLGG